MIAYMDHSCLRALLIGLGLVALGCNGDVSSMSADPSDASTVATDSAKAVSDARAEEQGLNVDRSDPQLYDLELDPKSLDPSTIDSLRSQYALLDTQVAPIGQLVFFLPGANNSPGDWRNHGRKLASFGFHVLIPHYNNRWSGDGTCAGHGSSCYLDTRWEALTGEDVSDAIAISRADSAEGRVLTMLTYLRDSHPQGDWGYYLNDDGSLRYDRVVISGISHGAASTAMYATRRKFVRAVMHSGGPSRSADTSATPIDVWYSLAHTDDGSFAAISSGWESANMLGVITSIDDSQPPYGGAHMLKTSVSNCYPHCSTVVHSCSPPENMPVYDYEEAWRYMYGL